jgi:hypothetical protein
MSEAKRGRPNTKEMVAEAVAEALPNIINDAVKEIVPAVVNQIKSDPKVAASVVSMAAESPEGRKYLGVASSDNPIKRREKMTDEKVKQASHLTDGADHGPDWLPTFPDRVTRNPALLKAAQEAWIAGNQRGTFGAPNEDDVMFDEGMLEGAVEAN